MTDNEKETVIFQAILTEDKKIRIEIKTSNLMGISYAYHLLGLHLDNLIIKGVMPKPKIIKTPSQGGLDSLKKFLNDKN